MNQEYFDKVTELEKMNASDQYILGWQEGYQDAPEVEEQRVTVHIKQDMKTVRIIISIT